MCRLFEYMWANSGTGTVIECDSEASKQCNGSDRDEFE